jgi:hypothetical protein
MAKTEEKVEKLSVGIEYPQRRFGLIAIEKGFITVDQLWEALMRQKAQSSDTARRHIGMILKDMGYINVSQIDEVLEAMKEEMESKKPTPKLSKGSHRIGKTKRKKR